MSGFDRGQRSRIDLQVGIGEQTKANEFQLAFLLNEKIDHGLQGQWRSKINRKTVNAGTDRWERNRSAIMLDGQFETGSIGVLQEFRFITIRSSD